MAPAACHPKDRECLRVKHAPAVVCSQSEGYENSMKLLITGGAGFIGSAVIRHIVTNTQDSVVNVDKLTYAGSLESLADVAGSPRYAFEHVDICDRAALERTFNEHRPDVVMHLAAESHVDRSIDSPSLFIDTNIVGTYTLLETARVYWKGLEATAQEHFRFHHVSTDEVYGDLGDGGGMFTELSPYAPSSPYSASKASADHLVRAWQRTYGLPTLITNCSNNYGPYHYPEKLIPLMILSALCGNQLPIYGKGEQIRDWLYVDDHARALYKVITEGQVGETYNIGGHNEKTNLEVVQILCDLLQELAPAAASYHSLISFVVDRPGHDRRYAIDASKIERELGWTPQESFESGIRKTIEWYLENLEWCHRIKDGSSQQPHEGLGITV